MADKGIRRAVLVNSVNKLLGEGQSARDVAMVWNRHRWFVPYCLFAGLALFAVATAIAIEPPVNRVIIGACGAAVASLATTEWWVVAQTDAAIVLCRSSRVRQRARSIVTEWKHAPEISMRTSNVITSDWHIDDRSYTTTKRWEPALRRIQIETGQQPQLD